MTSGRTIGIKDVEVGEAGFLQRELEERQEGLAAVLGAAREADRGDFFEIAAGDRGIAHAKAEIGDLSQELGSNTKSSEFL